MFLLGKEEGESVLSTIIIFVALVLPALGAAIGTMRTHREYSRREKRSYNMVNVLREFDEEYIQIKSLPQLHSPMDETEKLMIQEAQDWLMLMKFVNVDA